MEFVFSTKKSSDFISNLLHEFNINSKVIKRSNKYMVYVKASEEISDMLKVLGTNQSLFYFEEIRTEKDHINMVNRLNNCEQANLDKTINTGLKQIDDIIGEYLAFCTILKEQLLLYNNDKQKENKNEDYLPIFLIIPFSVRNVAF